MGFLTLVQIISAVLLIVVIILQNRGTQAGVAFGTYGETYRSKKGIERVLFYSTIFFAAIFASVSILAVLI